MAALSTIAAIAAIGASAASVGSTLLAKKPKAPQAPTEADLPKQPDGTADAEKAARERDFSAAERKRQQEARLAAGIGRSGTLLTGGQGLTAPAPVQRETLLGS